MKYWTLKLKKLTTNFSRNNKKLTAYLTKIKSNHIKLNSFIFSSKDLKLINWILKIGFKN